MVLLTGAPTIRDVIRVPSLALTRPRVAPLPRLFFTPKIGPMGRVRTLAICLIAKKTTFELPKIQHPLVYQHEPT